MEVKRDFFGSTECDQYFGGLVVVEADRHAQKCAWFKS